MDLEAGSLIVLVGAAGSGKSTWAKTTFGDLGVVSTDALRALVGEGETDQRANKDIFALLDEVLLARVRRKLTTIVDSTALEVTRRTSYVSLANRFGVPIVAIVFRASADTCLSQNKLRDRNVPQEVIRSMVQTVSTITVDSLVAEGFDHVVEIDVERVAVQPKVRVIPTSFVQSSVREETDRGLRIELAVSRFAWPDGASGLRDRLTTLARQAEEVGVSGIWLMDHYRQIPQVGREWEDLPELISTLGFLGGVTTTLRLGSLVASVSARTIPQLARSFATLDVLSGGRAVCGLGAGWFEAEASAVGVPLPPRNDRYEMLEDALRALPLFWGKGSPSFEGHHLQVEAALAYPRPLQNHIPILVGGSGRRTLSLAAKYADAINVQGTLEKVSQHVAFLRSRLQAAGRSQTDIEVTHLGPILVGDNDADLTTRVNNLRGRTGDQRFREAVNAGTVSDQVGRLRALTSAGVSTAIVSLADLTDPDAVFRLAPLIEQTQRR